MTGATAELPISSSSPNLTSRLGNVTGQSGRAALERSPANANEIANPNDNGSPEVGSFQSNWQAMVTSMETLHGEEQDTGSAGPGAASVLGQSSSSISGKGIAPATQADSPGEVAGSFQIASSPTAGKLVRDQRMGAHKASQDSAAGPATGSISSAASLRKDGSQPIRSDKASAASDPSHGVMAPALAFGGDPSMMANIAAGHASHAEPASSRGNRASTAAGGDGDSRSALAANPAFPAHGLAIAGTNGESLSLAGSNAQAHGNTDPSYAGANGLEGGALTLAPRVPPVQSAAGGDADESASGGNLIASVNGSLDGAAAAISLDALSQSTSISAASISSSERRASAINLPDSSVGSSQRTQRPSAIGIAAGSGPHNSEFSQVNPAASNPGHDSYPLAVSGAGMGSANGSTLGSAPGTSLSAGTPSGRETFAALDGDAPAGSIRWTHTGANRAEAGFEDPALGWVGVRADMGGGSVHASLVPGSAEAAQMLGSHLAGLNNYLAERHSGVSPVTVAGQESFGSAHSGTGSESGSQPGSQSFTEQNGSANSGNGWIPAGSNSTQAQSEGRPDSLPSTLASSSSSNTAQPASRSSGRYISVMA